MKAKIIVGMDRFLHFRAIRYENKKEVYKFLKCDLNDGLLNWDVIIENHNLSPQFDIHLLKEEKYSDFLNSFVQKGLMEIIELH